MRNYFIKVAKKKRYEVIDMQPILILGMLLYETKEKSMHIDGMDSNIFKILEKALYEKIITFISFGFFIVSFIIICGCETGIRNSDKRLIKIEENVQGEGNASITPHELTAGRFETLTIEYTVGPSGIPEGGAIWIDDPDFNGMGWSIFQNFQVKNPNDNGYVSARVISSNMATSELERISPPSNQMRHYIICTIKDAPLMAGDQIIVVYGDTSQSKSGAGKVPKRAYKNVTFRLYTDTDANGIFHPAKTFPVINIRSSRPSKIIITGPSFVKIDRPFETTVRILDQYGNPAEDYSGTVSFTSADPDADLPESYTFSPIDKGVHVFHQNYLHAKGIHYITAKDLTYPFEDQSNPIAMVEALPEYDLYWGDLHGHHGHIFCDSGQLNSQYYDYARDVSDLDFTCETAKSSSYWNVEETWSAISKCCYLYNDPGKFVTFLGFEWMNTTRGQGHHCVYYRDDYQPYYSPESESSDTLPELWNLLSDKKAITVPHATIYTGFNWNDQNNKLRPLAEIYSAWGSSEENRIPSRQESYSLREYFRMLAKKIFHLGKFGSVQQGLAQGNKMGFIACSDTHWGQPGGTKKGLHAVGGLTAVYAKALSRSDIWDSLLNRKTYGTTGARILLNFQINGHMMGKEFKTSSDPIIKVKVSGTSIIQTIDIMKCNYTTSKKCFISYSEKPNKKKTILSWVDKDFTEDCCYYVRVIQYDGNMAWSSPIWVNQR